MIEIRQTETFAHWFKSLRDERAQMRIQKRINRLSVGLFGDAKFFDGIGELRIDYGPGYRLYFVKQGNRIVILLCGGNKSTQRTDIRQAIEMAKEV